MTLAQMNKEKLCLSFGEHHRNIFFSFLYSLTSEMLYIREDIKQEISTRNVFSSEVYLRPHSKTLSRRWSSSDKQQSDVCRCDIRNMSPATPEL